jgi:alkylation response protein AidB-like acyl-CoA dehydrogenase
MTDTLQRVKAAAPVIRAEAAASAAGGRLTDPVVAALRDAGVYRMTMSRALGGPELSVPEQIEVLEEVSAADGAAGWCGMINSDGGYMTAFLAPDVARKMYPTLDEPTAAVANPTGRAVDMGDHYVVTGQWPFTSGSPQCGWFFLNCLAVDQDGAMQPGSEGLPKMRLVAIPAAEIEILDTWHTTGLEGTASNDVRVSDVVVPAERTLSLFDDSPTDPAPLYRWRFTFITNMGAVPLGIARAALDEAKEVASTKVTFPTLTLAREDPTVQWNIGKAEALVRSARAYMYDTAGTFWDAVSSGRDPSDAEWRDLRIALLNAAHASKEAVTLLYEALGTTGVYSKSPLDRHLRDVTTLAQHVVCQTKIYAAAGRVLLGLPSGTLAL